MTTLILVGLVSGIITAISPCVLPVLPAILTSAVQDGAKSRRRPVIVISGLVTSFAVFTLLGGILLGALNFPADALRWAGIIVLAIVGIGLLVPQVGHLLERPFVNTKIPTLNREGNGFVMGIALGLVFVPCAGPILASITVLAATNGLSWGLVALTLAFSVGIAIPLLGFGLAGQAIGARIKAVRERLETIRRVSGAILIFTALIIAFNGAEALQRYVPPWLSNFQTTVEDSDSVRTELDNLAGLNDADVVRVAGEFTFDECEENSAVLANCGPIRDFPGITSWLNTPGNEPLTAADLEGKVVLVDFWTYSCINCQRTFPYLTQWYERYEDDGLVIIGVHSPEFAFEKVEGNVIDATERYGINYPVALDNDFITWREWDQRFWPAHYLIDKNGTVVQVHYGEGKYAETERLIQELLDAEVVAPVTAEADGGTSGRSPETYVGSQRLERMDNGRFPENLPEEVFNTNVEWVFNPEPVISSFSLGGVWNIQPEYAVTSGNAKLAYHFYASDVHLVIGGEGTVRASLASSPDVVTEYEISGAPDLYTFYSGEATDDVLLLEFSHGLEAYAFTFG